MALKVHIPGPLIGSIQKCTRCHTRMDNNQRWPDDFPVGWKAGVSVLASRSGMGVVTVEVAAQHPACGRK